MNRRLIVARIISVTGSLLLMVAAIHLLVTPVLKSAILDRVLTLQELRIVSPPFLLNHIVVGVLLIPLGFISLYTASGIRAGERWAWVINLAITANLSSDENGCLLRGKDGKGIGAYSAKYDLTSSLPFETMQLPRFLTLDPRRKRN